MASVVDTSVKYFDSTMPNAPVLGGTPSGGLIALLDACLKDGFNQITLTSLVVSGGVATATWTGTHAALKDTVVLIAGVTGALTALNGEQKVTSKPNSTSLTFATAAADGTAAGTITMKMAPMGWAKPFSGTNLAAYQSSDVTSSKCLLRVDDSGTTPGAVRVVGYESMTDINTGVGAFPTAAQVSGGGYWVKSNAANATAVAWAIIGDGKRFYFNVQPASNAGATQQVGVTRFFGDINATKPGGDAYACGLNYSLVNSISTMSEIDIGSISAGPQFAFPRDYSGVGSGVISNLTALSYLGNNTTFYSGINALAGSFPSPVDGGVWLCPKVITLGYNAAIRGYLPGVYHALQSGTYSGFKLGDRTAGSGTLAGRNLVSVTTTASGTTGVVSTAGNTGNLFFDLTGPW